MERYFFYSKNMPKFAPRNLYLSIYTLHLSWRNEKQESTVASDFVIAYSSTGSHVSSYYLFVRQRCIGRRKPDMPIDCNRNLRINRHGRLPTKMETFWKSNHQQHFGYCDCLDYPIDYRCLVRGMDGKWDSAHFDLLWYPNHSPQFLPGIYLLDLLYCLGHDR